MKHDQETSKAVRVYTDLELRIIGMKRDGITSDEAADREGMTLGEMNKLWAKIHVPV